MYLRYLENDKMWNITDYSINGLHIFKNKIHKNINKQQQNKKGYLSDTMHAH